MEQAAATAVAWPGQPNPGPAPGPGPVMAPGPGFAPLPAPPPGPANPDPPMGPRPQGDVAGDGAEAGTAPRSTTVSTDQRVLFRGRAKTFQRLFEMAFKAVGGLANRALAAGEDDGCFLPDDEDLKTVPPPIARVAARRVELPVDGENLSDAEDLIAAAIAFGVWLVKGLVDMFEARRDARRAKPGADVAVNTAGETGGGQ